MNITRRTETQRGKETAARQCKPLPRYRRQCGGDTAHCGGQKRGAPATRAEKAQYRRQNISFCTKKEGHVPLFFDTFQFLRLAAARRPRVFGRRIRLFAACRFHLYARPSYLPLSFVRTPVTRATCRPVPPYAAPYFAARPVSGRFARKRSSCCRRRPSARARNNSAPRRRCPRGCG